MSKPPGNNATGSLPVDRKWPVIWVLSFAELLAMGVWFSASAVVPALTAAWDLSDAGRAWLTMSVQLGFVCGALTSSFLNLADRFRAHHLFAVSAWLAALSTLLIPLISRGLSTALPLRFLTGFFLAGVYPVGMKIMATWTKEDRGLGIGILVGALTVGTASPHLLNAFGGIAEWKPVMVAAGSLAALGGVLGIAFVDEGPFRTKAPPFDWKYAIKLVRQRDIVLANLGYLGHMWELYAMWAWISVFLLARSRPDLGKPRDIRHDRRRRNRKRPRREACRPNGKNNAHDRVAGDQRVMLSPRWVPHWRKPVPDFGALSRLGIRHRGRFGPVFRVRK